MDINQLYMLMNLYQASRSMPGNVSGTGYRSTGIAGAPGGAFRQTLQNAVLNSGGISTPMDDIFEEASKETGVDIRLLKAVGKAESGFDPSATSHCGAMGVMQLMPATAASLGVLDAYDARQNIMGGARYLSSLLERYDGNVRLAVAAYNAGSGNVDKYGGVPPFKETQNYVARVLEYAGTDISTGRNVDTRASAGTLSDSAYGMLDLDYAEVFKMMTEMMRLELQEKLDSITDFGDDENGGNSSNYASLL